MRRLEHTKSGKEAIQNLPAINSENIQNEVLGFADLSAELQDAINTTVGFSVHTNVVDMFNLLLANPNIPVMELLLGAKISNNTYYGKLLGNQVIKNQIIEYRKMKSFDDVVSAYGVMVALTKNSNPQIAFNASKFLLENIGQMYGFGKKDETAATSVFELIDKRTEKPKYSNQELEDI